MSGLGRGKSVIEDAPRLDRPVASTPPVGGPDLITPAVLAVLRERLRLELRLDRSRQWDEGERLEVTAKLVLADPEPVAFNTNRDEVICEVSDSVSLPSTETSRY